MQSPDHTFLRKGNVLLWKGHFDSYLLQSRLIMKFEEPSSIIFEHGRDQFDQSVDSGFYLLHESERYQEALLKASSARRYLLMTRLSSYSASIFRSEEHTSELQSR